MAPLLLFVFMTSHYYLCGAVDITALQKMTGGDIFHSLCSRRCNIDSEISPLHQCSCSMSCAVYGDCCYDSHYRNLATRKHFICITVAERDRYKAVSSCESYRGSKRCKENLGYLPPVTNTETNITYANFHCARCNGETGDLVTWDVKLRCPSLNERETKDISPSTNEIIYEKNDFWRMDKKKGTETLCEFHMLDDDFTDIDDLELRSCDLVERISTCSATWKDVSVEKKCLSYEDPVYHHNTTYQNSHCAKCNYVNLSDVECFSDHKNSMLQMKFEYQDLIDNCETEGCILERTKGISYSLRSLFNVDDCQPPPERLCCAGLKYNSIEKKCTEFTQ